MIVGLGETGLSYARYLAARGESYLVMDQSPNAERIARLHEISAEARIVDLTVEEISHAETVYVSPGVPLSHPAIVAAKKNGAVLKGDVQMFGELAGAPVVAITGTNGKSTVAELTHAMAVAQNPAVVLAGNIGTPCLDVIDETVELYVLEVSSYQLELAQNLRSKVAVVLNLSPDHLDRYPDENGYYETKLSLYSHCDSAVINRELNPRVPGRIRVATFGADTARGVGQFGLAESDRGLILTHDHEALVEAGDLNIGGTHNLLNVLAALAIGWLLDLDLQKMIETTKQFKGLAHRSEFVAEVKGVRYVNDSKATNPGALVAAVTGETRSRNIHLIAGGVSKDVDFNGIEASIEPFVKSITLIGEAGDDMEKALGHLQTRRCGSLAEAVDCAAAEAVPGDIVLLSPGCASFDQFRNYIDRGDTFRACVGELAS
ncbi:MAG: UDP-N-acetylmuramoyl-L-alanine--D-glutamate ligase [Gammaproteobacteria bacterium]|nr:UDP-N-acetylmuramoyl-L-alanine--D-glutamate ligase [Gammaproteobacteria bacterium]